MLEPSAASSSDPPPSSAPPTSSANPTSTLKPDFLPPPHPFSSTESSLVYALSKEDSQLGRSVAHALGVIEEAFERFGIEGTALSFNGGKDCTVLIHLLAAALYRRTSHPSTSTASTSTSTPSSSSVPHFPPSASSHAGPTACSEPAPEPSSTAGNHSSTSNATATSSEGKVPQIETVYVRPTAPFPQVEEFVELCRSRYAFISLSRVEGGMKGALEGWMRGVAERRRSARVQMGMEGVVNGDAVGEGAEGSGIKAVLVGTRRGDPHGAPLRIFDPTDSDWPSFVRVHPIIDWEYPSVWEFLQRLGVGWCNLYNYGYTSLGSTNNTFPNPLLKDESRPSGWKPAWELADASFERAGRS